jgi:glycosyltransferase involved in cell wall biosynthesis
MSELKKIRTAVCHHWFTELAGGEKVFHAMCDILENPDLFCIVANRTLFPESMQNLKLTISFIQSLPYGLRFFRKLFFCFPIIVESFDVSGYDLVVSSDASVMKGILTEPETCHVCYCHSPMRYIWNMPNLYLQRRGILQSALIRVISNYLRIWDFSAAARVNFFIANSKIVRNRIRKYYRRDAKIIYPPCDTEKFYISDHIDNFYLLVGRQVEYKKQEIAIRAFAENGKQLLVVGSGYQRKWLESIATKNIHFLGRISDEHLAELYSSCKALIFPGEEDFGIVPVEAQASGRPVIAFAKGGALETIVDLKTGVLFHSQTVEAIKQAVHAFEQLENRNLFDPSEIRKHALRFSRERFQSESKSFLEQCIELHREKILR